MAILPIALVVSSPAPAHAADHFVPGTRLTLKRTGTAETMTFVSRGPLAVPTSVSGDAPTAGGATVEIVNPKTSESFTFDLPSSHWTVNSAGTIYRYSDSSLTEPAKIKVAIIDRGLRISGRKCGITLDKASQGALAVVVTIGSVRYCARFDGGSVRRDGPGCFSARGAPPPGACSTLASTTSAVRRRRTTTTTSTTSLGGSTSTTLPGGSSTTGAADSSGCDCCCFSELSFTTGLPQIGTGGCANTGGVTTGSVTDDANANLCNLAAGGLYFGGAGVGIPLPAAIPDTANSITKIANCNATAGTFDLVAASDTDTGSNRNCTTAGANNPEYPGKPGCLFGAPLPIPNANGPATSTCVVNRLQSDASGSGTCGGTSNIAIPLLSDIYLTGPTDGLVPCPRCAGGTCQAGPNSGQPCTPGNSASLGNAYPTSHDCPPASSAFIGSLPIPFALTTGTSSATSTDFASQSFVFCGFCGQQFSPSFETPAHPCTADSQCTTGAFTRCRQRNSGAFGQGPARRISMAGSPAGVCIDDGAAHAATLASVFCIPPTFNATVDAAGDLPGPGAVSLPGTSQLTAPIPQCTTSTIAETTTTTSLAPTTTNSSVPLTTTTSSTSTTVTSTTLRSCPPPPLPVGSIALTIGEGSTSCGGTGLVPGPAAPVSGEIDDGTGTKISDLGLGCLYLGGGANGSVPGVGLPDGSTAILDVSGANGLRLTLSGSNGTGPDTCTRRAGPARHCANGSPGRGGGACTTDADCGQSHACVLDANCFFGPPAPVPAGPLSSCAVNAIGTDPCGSADLTSGSSTLSVELSSRFYLTGDAASPCPRCVSGVCTAGERAGLSCSGVGSKGTSRECPPSATQFIGEVPIALSQLSTGTSTTTHPDGIFCPGQKVPGSFGQSGARTIRQTGTPLLGGPTLFSTSLAGNFCVPATGTPLIDNSVDLPGPGSVSVTGVVSVCLLGLLCL